MGVYLKTEKIVAFVPKGKKRYYCQLCPVQFGRDDMKLHLEIDHELKVSGGGYAFYEEEK